MSTHNPWVVETSLRSFEQDVIERSRECPVVVDFWAEWCAPCRMLGPVLEKLAEEYAGKFVLVKANTEEVGPIASSFGVRSIPAVFGLRDGKIRDSFVGVLAESALRGFVDGLMPSPAETVVSEARGLEASDPSAAEARYRAALELDPNTDEAATGLTRVLLAQGRFDEARQQLEALERRRGILEPEAEKLRAELTLRSQAREAGGLDEARAAAAARPDDLGLKFKLAEALAAAGRYEEALDLCLELVERDRKGIGEEARKTMLAIFQMLDGDDLVGDYQRKLAAALF